MELLRLQLALQPSQPSVEFQHLKRNPANETPSELINMGIFYRQIGNEAVSWEYLMQALRKLLATGQFESGKDSLFPIALEVLGLLAMDQEEMRHAAVVLGATEAQREALNARWSEAEWNDLTQEMAPIRAILDENEFASAWAKGRAMTLEQITAYVLESQ
ncbi:hypothetical protein [Deinococcus arenicola]|uniref:Uncharacterized protein n=1 Tax=Deinococcus arenicola TaxID=2994950 RepID=A0ABU4DRX4_9DEIO|nr:hypothetical protein [Deinococcus sp. ZS9-10]MDV6375191.1 hypothetical protein [Deinococcus sp. ZS9-10]